jgi:hypothetical protein
MSLLIQDKKVPDVSEVVLKSVLAEADKKITALRAILFEQARKLEEEIASGAALKSRNLALIEEKDQILTRLAEEARVQQAIFQTIKSHAIMLASDTELVKDLGLSEQSKIITEKQEQLSFIIEHSRKLKMQYFELKVAIQKQEELSQSDKHAITLFTHFTSGVLAVGCGIAASSQAGVAVGVLVGGPVGAIAGLAISGAVVGIRSLINNVQSLSTPSVRKEE